MTGYFGSIEKDTEDNEFFRKVLFTGKHEQLVAMSLKPGEEIGNEKHDDTDQFFRVEEGQAKFVLGNGKEEYILKAGGGAVVPAGTWHNVINMLKTKPLKIYTVYAPPNHPAGTIHKTKEEAEAAEAKEHKK